MASPFGRGMLANCANESCTRQLHSFTEGRLFQFEIVSISLAATDEACAPFDEKPLRETVHFWLCGQCASNFNLVLEPSRGLKLVSISGERVEPVESPMCSSNFHS